ncbi:hypothetical protein ES332_D11G396400v1 [Gossypium tomentosum]|uniref:MADS-box domain-containing protein n=1 Tax=Gossypium tomentosum TaxID=34277 RepID=A0A5D2IX37_GOSTO|nr:hypothetical protein ES332_D11G396400v1 [Gossypium tomentosum]
MRRKRVTLAGISNDNARRASLKKRRLGIMKKRSELIIHYGGHVYQVIYRPDESEPMIWSSHDEVQHLLDEYSKTPKLDCSKKTVN